MSDKIEHNVHTIDGKRISRHRIMALLCGPMSFLILFLLDTPGNLSPEAWKLIAVIMWMVIWWMTEAIPVPVTALLPIPLLPLLDIADQQQVTSNYGHPLIFLFLGGFIIAAAMQRWGLHKRIALNIVSFTGRSAQGIILGFMLATAFLSMWVSNTATTVMMYAVGVSIIELVSEKTSKTQSRRFAIALLLGIAYSASIGGVGTLIGTPPNILLASFLSESYNITIDFSTWMMLGIPIVIILLPITWFLLCKIVFTLPDINFLSDKNIIKSEINALGKVKTGEKIVLIIFIVTALLWLFRKGLVSITGLTITDTSIAMTSAILLFIIPASIEKGTFTIEWDVTQNIPWGVLFLFGGGLTLASAFNATGLAGEIGHQVASINNIDISILILLTITIIIFLTEITSNTATTATFLPILSAVAIGLDVSPMVLAIPAALAASMAFMMPVATPPNAIVFSYEDLHVNDMVKAGVWLNLITIGLIYLLMHTLAPLVFNIHF